MKYDQSKIRNFSVIAHIDHGKSTLCDRILELTETIEKREMKSQILDDMDLERERGITIKLNAVTVNYHAKNGEDYILNLIDTPGHVDFTYEVSRSLAACEGAVLVIDSTQGVEAQTLANMYLAIDNNLEIVPVLNKIDLASSRIEACKEEITSRIGLDGEHAIPVSAKTGENIKEINGFDFAYTNPGINKVLQAIGRVIRTKNDKGCALIIDSRYSYGNYRKIIESRYKNLKRIRNINELNLSLESFYKK